MVTLIPVLLAGGQGTRLWPLSSTSLPKQFQCMGRTNLSLFQIAVKRALTVTASHHCIIVTTTPYHNIVTEQLRAIQALDNAHILLEPVGKNTAPALLLAALYAETHWGADTLLCSFPTDHYIEQPTLLSTTITTACRYVTQGKIATFGITPHRMETQYGYIIPGAPIEPHTTVYHVARFIEKPDHATLTQLHATPLCLWNSGIFLFSVHSLCCAIELQHPTLASTVTHAYAHAIPLHQGIQLALEDYAFIPSCAIDRVVMEHSEKLIVQHVDMEWTDVGSWQTLWEISEKDLNGNVCQHSSPEHRGKNCFIVSQKPVITGEGIEDLVIVETDHEILVTKKKPCT